MTTSINRPVQLARHARLFLLLLSEANVLLGALLYLYPALVIPYWPWPVKELAVRFLGAIFLAIAFGCWSALRAKMWQRAKILVLVGGVFFGLTSIVSISQGISSSGFKIWAWTGYFLAATLGCTAILASYRWRRKPQDLLNEAPLWKPARIFFRVQTIIVGVFGLTMFLLPAVAQEQFWPWKVAVPTLQTFASLFLATCLATGWGSIQKDVGRMRILLPLDAVFPSLALLAVGIHWSVIMTESPSWLVTAVWVGLYSFVAAGSTYFYFSSRTKR